MIRFFFVSILLLCNELSLASLGEISLKKSVFINSSNVSLHQIVEGDLPSEIAGIVLTQAPRIGKSLLIKRGYVQKLLVDHGFDQYGLNGNHAVKVRSLSQIIPKKKIVTFIQEYMINLFGTDEGVLKVSIHIDSKVEVPIGRVYLKIKKVHPEKLKNKNHVWLSISVNNKYYQTVKILVESENQQLWPFAKYEISKSEPINDHKIRYKLVNILSYETDALNVEYGQWQARKLIKENSPILLSLVKKRPLVKRSDIFRGVSMEGKIIINVKIEALEHGYLVDRIEVLRPVSQEKFYVRLKLDKNREVYGVIE